MKKVYAAFLMLFNLAIFLLTTGSAAQVPYSVTPVSGMSYSSISNGTVINSTGQLSPGQTRNADDGTVLVNLPFSFSYCGKTFSQATFCTNGWLALGNYSNLSPTMTRTGANLFSNALPNNTIGGWFKDGTANFPAPYGSGSMVHGMIDTGVYAFEWKNAAGTGYSLTTVNMISYMIKLYGPASSHPGRIEVLYGPQAGTFSAGAAIGIEDSTGHFINAVNGSTTSTVTSSVWPGNGNGYRFEPLQPCSGVPAGGAAFADNPSICALKPFVLNVNNASTGTGINYQWQSSTDNLVWSDIANRTDVSYTVTSGITQSTWFRRAIKCGNNTGYSTPVLVAVKDPSVCYCTTNSSGSALHSVTGNPNIDSVSITGTTLNNNNVGAPPTGLTQFPPAGNTTATLIKGGTYSLTVKLSGSGDGSVWFDWNRNGTYEPSEWKSVAYRTAGGTIIFTIPTTAAAGVTGMRIRSRTSGNGNDSTAACAQFGSGETEEYLITIANAQACVLSPATVSVNAPADACTGQNFTLTATGYTYATGLTFKWQSAPATGSTWTTIAGATSATYTTAQTAATKYRVLIACNNTSPTSATPVTVAMKTSGCPPVNNEPCGAIELPLSRNDSCTNKRIGNTALATTSLGLGYNNPIGCSVGYAPKDVWFKVRTDSTGRGSTSLYFRLAKTAGSTMTTATMVLFSMNAACPSPTLAYQGTCKNSTSGFPPYIMKAENLMPNTTYYLRISPCADSDPTGEFELCAYIPPVAAPCVTKVYPKPTDTVVVNQPSVMKWRNVSAATSYDLYLGETNPPQYYTSTSDTSFQKTFAAYNRKYFWQVVPNSIAGPPAACEIDSFVTQLPPLNCIPMTSSNCGMGDTLKLFTLLGEDSTKINNASGCSPQGYGNYTNLPAAKVYPGNAYSGTFMTSEQINYVTIWIDVNNDGRFSNDERLLNNLKVLGKNIVTPYVINIPATMSAGSHRLRVRNIYWPYVMVNATDACNFYTFSETEDYLVNVDSTPLPPRPLVSRAMANNCMVVGSLTVDDSTNNNNNFINIVDEHNEVVAAINANGNNLGTINATVYKNSGAVRTSSSGMKYLDRNITITPQNQPLTPVTVRLFFTEDELAALQNADPMVADRSSISVTKTSDNCNANGGVPATGVAVPQAANGSYGSDHYIEVVVTGFSTFYLNRDASILPVTIKSFTGTRGGNVNMLKWTTSSEANCAGYELERSIDGNTFSRFAFVPSRAADGNSNIELAYSYNDEKPFKGNTYYRLKQLDKNGRHKYSNVIVIKGTNTNEIEIGLVYPNPVDKMLNLMISSPASEKVSIVVTDMTGKAVMQKGTQLVNGDNRITLDAEQLPSGNYLVKVVCTGGCRNAVGKFVKQ